jgi:peptidoglycan/xylan/chitin deacetylase (PgdA/CDA1 family)
MKTCITVDLDNAEDYRRLIDPEKDVGEWSFYDEGIPRFLDIFDRLGVCATFFVVGRDGAREANRRLIRKLHERGHEVANHSQTHPYNFRQLTRSQKEEEIRVCEEVIADITGERPLGFRTPSLDVDGETLEILAERGYVYDSSILPTPLMFAFMVYGELFVRHGDYQLGPAACAFAPAMPYVPRRDRVHRRDPDAARRGGHILEIPTTVSPGLRIPFYGTFLRLLGRRALDWLVRSAAGRPMLVAGFHLQDLVDLTGTPLEAGFARSPGLALPLEQRERFVSHAFGSIAAAGEPMTLCQAARSFLAENGLG